MGDSATGQLVPLRCGRPGCVNILGQSDGRRLYLGGVILLQRTVMHCPLCGGYRVWYPSR